MVEKSSKIFSSSLPSVVGFLSVATLVAGFGTWAAVAQIDGAVIASGRIVVDRNRQAVQHLDGGVVKEVLVKEGDTVNQNDVLVRLDPTLTLSEKAVIESRLYELMARRGRMEAERDDAETITFDPRLLEKATQDPKVKELVEGQQRLFEARRETLLQALTQLQNQKLQLGNQINGIDAQMVALERQLQLIGDETKTQISLLERGLAQASRVLNLQREDARLSGLRGELTARRAQAMERSTEIDIEMLKIKTQRREDAIATLRDLQMGELETDERLQTLTTQLERMQIRAPVAGIVYDVRLFGERSVIRPADPLMFIVPQDRPLVIEAKVEPKDVNKVHSLQQVVLRFTAFEMRNTPDLLGTVTRVSPDAFSEPDSGRPYYRAEIELPNTELSKLTEDQTLIPGMPVESFIRTGEYTPLAYLTAPITRYLTRAMRDDS